TRANASDAFVGDYGSPDWIEVHNPTDAAAVLDEYHLTDDLGDPTRWAFPAGTSLEAGGYLIVFASGEDIIDPALDENGCLHTDFKLSDDGGEDVVLTDADGTVVFGYCDYPVQSEDISYGVGGDGLERFFPAPTPGWDNANDVPRAPAVTVAGTTFTDSVTVELIASYPTDTVHYTLDETLPNASSPVYGGELTIAETTMVRAAAIGANGKSSVIVSETYIELGADVLDDSSNLPVVIVETFGDGVPVRSYGFGDSFIAVFEPGADGRTRLTDPFVIGTRSGIHIRGSSSAGFPKKQYRVEFWDEYDEDRKLKTLGMPGEADWILYGPNQYDRALINNPLMCDLSNQVGRYAVRTRWVEMYLNANGGEVTASDYVGVYALMEVVERGDDRVDIEALSSGAGGVPVDGGFAWKKDKSGKYVEPEDPNSAQRSFIDGYSNSLLSAATGPNFTDPDLGYAAWADVDSFIDHNLINMLAMNVDALRISTYYYKTREGKLEAGPIWDFDRALDSTDGRDNNPCWWNGTGDSTLYFNDGSRVMLWWPRMFQDGDFVQKYIDRWFELRGGVFSLENIYATIDAHAAELQEAAPREYARWSAARYGGFAGEIQHMKDWLTARINWIDSQWLARPALDVAGPVVTPGTQVTLSSPVGQVYYTLDGSDPRGFGGAAGNGAILADGPITVDAYTQITARVYLANHGPTSQGYVPSGDDWSAPVVAEYFVNPLVAPGDVIVSEINYHPFDPTPEELASQPPGDPDFLDDDFEFVELLNVTGHAVNVRGVKFDDGIEFTFGSHVLADGGRIVVVRKAEAFAARYGINGSLDGTGIAVAGAWTGRLDNGGEKLAAVSRDGAASVVEFAYNDAGDWPERADGKGSSLEIIDAAGDCGDPDNWRSSVAYGGTPGAGPRGEVGVVVNEVLTHTDEPDVDTIELHNTTDQAIDIAGWYLSDSWGWAWDPANGDYKKFQVPVLDIGEVGKTLLGGGAYIVFDEGDFNASGGTGPNDFALSAAHGDDVWLMQADADGRLVCFSDHVEFGAAANGESFGRWPNGSGELYPMTAPTLNGANSGPRVGPVVISEVMYCPGMFHEGFSTGGAERFVEVLGDWLVADGRYCAAPGAVGCDAVAVVDLADPLWPDYVLKADVNAAAAGGGYASNAGAIFDYHGQTDFKFARLSVDEGEWQIGRRDAHGWVVDASVHDPTIEAGKDHDLELRVAGSLATLVVDGNDTISHDFGEALHDGSLGIGTEGAIASFGMVAVEPPCGGDLEFIELYNPTDEAIDLAEWRDNPHQAGQYLAGWRLRGGVDMEFSEGDTIEARGTLVVLSFAPGDPANASRVAAFRGFYGIDG
ncbi:MAG: CotH kinase family protein, partial [Phycisphaerae bacterium]